LDLGCPSPTFPFCGRTIAECRRVKRRGLSVLWPRSMPKRKRKESGASDARNNHLDRWCGCTDCNDPKNRNDRYEASHHHSDRSSILEFLNVLEWVPCWRRRLLSHIQPRFFFGFTARDFAFWRFRVISAIGIGGVFSRALMTASNWSLGTLGMLATGPLYAPLASARWYALSGGRRDRTSMPGSICDL
jgi:hypothetical protein